MNDYLTLINPGSTSGLDGRSEMRIRKYNKTWVPEFCVRRYDSHCDATVSQSATVKLQAWLSRMKCWAVHALDRAKRTSGSRDMRFHAKDAPKTTPGRKGLIVKKLESPRGNLTHKLDRTTKLVWIKFVHCANLS